MRMIRFSVVLIAISFLISTIAFTSTAEAQTAALTVSPALSDFRAEPGDIETVDMVVRNSGDDKVDVTVSIDDFTPGEEGNPVYETNTQYSLARFIDPIPGFSLAPDEQKFLTATVQIPNAAPLQEHYGAITFTIEGEDGVGSLLFAAVGPPTYEGEIRRIAADSIISNGTSIEAATLKVQIANTGDYRFTPNTNLKIVDSNETTIANLKPDNPGSVLPKSTRTYTYQLTRTLDATKTYSIQLASTKLSNGGILNGSSVAPFGSTEPAEEQPAETDATSTSAPAEPTEEQSNDSTIILLFLGAGIVLCIILVGLITLTGKSRGQKRTVTKSSEPDAVDRMLAGQPPVPTPQDQAETNRTDNLPRN